ncbi:hypothetical protein AR687_17645 [Flavobacteriaceae bacterium CRH]|nr:hypothetical protein AR687_17645 [Flavobacteriaceae bacterium CRH]
MNIIEKYTEVFSFFKVKESFIIVKKDESKKVQISKLLGTDKKMQTQYLRYCGDYLYDFKIDKVLIYDSEFNFLYHVKQKGISSNNTSIDFINEEILIINQSIWDDNDNLVSHYTYYKNLNKKEEGLYCGKFLDDEFRINFIYEQKYNPLYFRISNLLDTKTYFEYECEPNEEISGDIIKYKEKLIFYSKEKEKVLYDAKFWINVLDIKTGKTIYKILIEHYGAFFDNENGHFISIQSTNQNNNIIKKYEIVDVNKGTIEKGNFDFDQEMFAVGTSVQYINNNKLYFVDNIYSYIEEKRKSPKIGCFDVITKQITFFQELKEAEGYYVNQIISTKNKLYLKFDNNELFVLDIIPKQYTL